MDQMAFQKRWEAQRQLAEEMPEAFHMAQMVISRWGKEQEMLAAGIAKAVAEAHELGRSGKPLPPVDPKAFAGSEPHQDAEPRHVARVARVARTAPRPPAPAPRPARIVRRPAQ